MKILIQDHPAILAAYQAVSIFDQFIFDTILKLKAAEESHTQVTFWSRFPIKGNQTQLDRYIITKPFIPNVHKRTKCSTLVSKRNKRTVGTILALCANEAVAHPVSLSAAIKL